MNCDKETENKIRLQESKIDKFSKAIEEMSDSYVVFDSDNLYLSSLIELLKTIFNDKEDWIGWWLWDEAEKIIWLPSGEEISLDTPEKLYDFLIENPDMQVSDK